ncbi:MAG: FecCD family ABC transporter permease [Campylobacterales bacterium]
MHYIFFSVTICLNLLFVWINLSSGSQGFELDTFRNIFALDESMSFIVESIRLPRVLAAIIAGSALALSGAILQNILRNPLASPFTVGVSQASAFGATFAIIVLGAYGGSGMFGFEAFPSSVVVVLSAFFCSATLLLFLVILYLNNLSSSSVILSGIAFGAFFGSLTMLLQHFGDDLDVAASLFWTFGDLGRVSKDELFSLFVVVFILYIVLITISFKFNVLSFGSDVAKSLGLRVRGFFVLSITISALLASLATAFFGIIGFVGIVAPHIIRLFFKENYRSIIVLSPLVGSLLLLVSDFIAKIAFTPLVLPIGIVTSLVGAPLFVFLLIRRGRVFG